MVQRCTQACSADPTKLHMRAQAQEPSSRPAAAYTAAAVPEIAAAHAGRLMPATWGRCRYAAENEQARQRFDSEKTVDKLLSAAQEVASQHSSMPPADLAAIFIALNRSVPVSKHYQVLSR